MSPSPKQDQALDEYWDALVAQPSHEPTSDSPAAAIAGQAPAASDQRLRGLLDDLNDARMLLRFDSIPSTPQFDQSETLRVLPPDAPLKIGTEVDGYRLTGELGRGGMGIVYAAEQQALGREVALKLIRTGPLATAEDLARFLGEASATAGLNHPGIVSVIDTGQWHGHHYFSMQLIDGPTLRQVFADGPLDPRQAATYVRGVSDAIQHAHEQGVLHRDLKPSNVILDVENDRPCVTDFGLAKLFRGPSADGVSLDWTQSGAMVGTPSYMSPEQALGDSKHVSPASDVYSIGAILYESLTGRAPFRAASPVETMRQVVDSEPVSPRALNPQVSRDLDTICLKCLSKNSEARYSTAAALRDELDRYLAGQPIQARPVGSLTKAWRWCRRNPLAAGIAALLATVLVGGGAVHNLRLSREIANTRAAEKLAQDNLTKAQDAQALAERDYERAAKAVERMLYTLGAVDLEDLPKGGELRRELLEESAKLQRQFVEDHPGDLERVQKLINAEQRLAEILTNQGEMDEAKTVLESVLQRVADFEGERDRTLNESELVVKSRVSNWYVVRGRHREAIEIMKETSDRCRELLETDPEGVAIWESNLASSSVNLSIISPDQADRVRYSKLAIEAYQSRIAAENKFSDRLGLAVAHSIQAMAIQYVEPDESLSEYESSMALLEVLAEERPEKVLVKQRLGETFYNMALLHRANGRIDEAFDSFHQSIAVREQIAEDFPDMVLDIAYLGGTWNAIGSTHMARAEFSAAIPFFEKGEAVARQLLTSHPDSNPGSLALYTSLINGGISRLRAGQLPSAAKQLKEAVAIVERLGETNLTRFESPLAYISLGEALYALGEKASGMAEMRSGLQLAKNNANNSPSPRTLFLLQNYYQQFATGLGHQRIDDQIEPLLDEIGADDCLAQVADGIPQWVQAMSCCHFCVARFGAEAAVAPELTERFDARVVELLQASLDAGYQPETPLREDQVLVETFKLPSFLQLAEFVNSHGEE